MVMNKPTWPLSDSIYDYDTGISQRKCVVPTLYVLIWPIFFLFSAIYCWLIGRYFDDGDALGDKDWVLVLIWFIVLILFAALDYWIALQAWNRGQPI